MIPPGNTPDTARSTSRELVRQAITFQRPARLPVAMGISGAAFDKYGSKLRNLAARYPDDIAGVGPHSPHTHPAADGTYVDQWGCTWKALDPSLGPQCVEHPLENLADWSTVPSPDPLGEVRWSGLPERLAQLARDQKYVLCACGNLVKDLINLRGFENAMMDLAAPRPMSRALVRRIEEYIYRTVRRALDLGVDGLILGDPLGQQDGLLVSPEVYRRELLPVYQRCFVAAHEAGRYVHFHTDGNVIKLLPELATMGADVLKLPLGALDIGKASGICRGRICVLAEPDRQSVLPHGSPADVRRHVKDIIQAFHTPQGGLIMGVKVNHFVPWENIVALLETLDPYL